MKTTDEFITRAILFVLVLAGPVFAQTGGGYDLTWSHVTAGGAMYSTGGAFSLGGTIGQSEAGPAMTGGIYAVTGGFWTAPAPVCTCPGDMTGDGTRNGSDIQQFVTCLISGQSCSCADVNGDAIVNPGDVSLFVTMLLTGS